MPPSYVHFDPDSQVSVSQTDLSPQVSQILKQHFQISSLYEMQQKALNHILAKENHESSTNDVIICAPTGSGKTLAYALPIVENLISRITPRTRAVVIVPTRDLAQQVSQVFQALCKPLDLSVAVVTGASSISREANTLRQSCDILIATPGRLVYHAKHTEGFDMKSVRFLVLDESDRLLHESYDQWLASLMPYVGHHPPSHHQHQHYDTIRNNQYRPLTGLFSLAIVPSIALSAGSDFKTVSDVRVRKILVSATQSQNPTHLVHLDMRHPTIFRVNPSKQKEQRELNEDQYTVPSTLLETGYVVKRIQEKPAALLHLLGWTKSSFETTNHAQVQTKESKGAKLIFTNSIDSAHRLCRLLELCAYTFGRHDDYIILEMSGELSAERRRDVVSLLHKTDDSKQKIPIIVSSDVLSRGMDIFKVDRVINYDAPAHLRTYLHRAGRTARAGRHGEVSSLLLAKQVHHFRRMVHEADRGEKVVKTFNLRSSDIINEDVEEVLAKALFGLKRVLRREKLNLLSKESTLPLYTLFELKTRCEEETMEDDSSGGNGDANGNWNGEEDYDPMADELHGINEHVASGGMKRKREGTEEEAMEQDDNDNSGQLDTDDIEGGIKGGGEDDLQHLLYAQIANNIMT